MARFFRRVSARFASGTGRAPGALIAAASLAVGALLLGVFVSLHQMLGGSLLQHRVLELELGPAVDWQSPGRAALQHLLHLDFPDPVDTRRYQRATLELAGPVQRGRFLLGWVADEQAGRPQVTRFERESDTRQILALEREPAWAASQAHLFLVLEGVPASALAEVELHRIILDSPATSWYGAWRSAVGHWFHFEGWNRRGWPGYSVDQIGVPGRGPALTIVLAAAIWTGLSLLVFWLWRRRARPAAAWLPAVAIVVLPWLLLDLRWQADLVLQLQATRSEFAGQTTLEKRLSSTDSSLVRFVEATRAQVESAPGRIFIVGERDDNYEVLRTRNYLLPLNAAAMRPEPEALLPGDYLMLFAASSGRLAVRSAPEPQAAERAGRFLLRWPDHDATVTAERVVQSNEGRVFRVLGPASPGE